MAERNIFSTIRTFIQQGSSSYYQRSTGQTIKRATSTEGSPKKCTRARPTAGTYYLILQVAAAASSSSLPKPPSESCETYGRLT